MTKTKQKPTVLAGIRFDRQQYVLFQGLDISFLRKYWWVLQVETAVCPSAPICLYQTTPLVQSALDTFSVDKLHDDTAMLKRVRGSRVLQSVRSRTGNKEAWEGSQLRFLSSGRAAGRRAGGRQGRAGGAASAPGGGAAAPAPGAGPGQRGDAGGGERGRGISDLQPPPLPPPPPHRPPPVRRAPRPPLPPPATPRPARDPLRGRGSNWRAWPEDGAAPARAMGLSRLGKRSWKIIIVIREKKNSRRVGYL